MTLFKCSMIIVCPPNIGLVAAETPILLRRGHSPRRIASRQILTFFTFGQFARLILMGKCHPECMGEWDIRPFPVAFKWDTCSYIAKQL